MRKLSADYVFPISQPSIKNGVVIVDANGTIVEVCSSDELNPAELETYKGIICPGFINAHCHLELSHLKGKIADKNGLDVFIKEIETYRNIVPEEVEEAIVKAENEMISNGIVAVGDISNGNASFAQKTKGRLRYHTFIEVFGFHPDKAANAFNKGTELYKNLKAQQPLANGTSITPHAPYSASEDLLKKLYNFAWANDSLLSIHNQESEEENKFFKNKEGAILQRLEDFGIDVSWWKPTGLTSLRSTLVHFPKHTKIQLVHNTVTTATDIEWAQTYSKFLWWCFCPNTNMYIENMLPNFQLFIDAGVRITIGTDSLASNKVLSVLEEIKTISHHAPSISLETLLTWSTLNGAEFLGFDKELGTIEKGKQPGLNLIEGIDLDKLKLLPDSTIRKLI